jgi:N-acetylglucosaminyldiphosphoundecaprenol N-acetyl-beta-D-mannosaminyltransferase
MNRNYPLLLLLGLPIHAIPKELLEETLSGLIQKYPRELGPSYATALQSAFIGQLSGYRRSCLPKTQVNETLRQASFLGIDSKALQILSFLLGNSIPRISSQDLLHAAGAYGSKHRQSLYLIGKDLDSCHQTAKALKEDYPGLKIAGFLAPNIYTKGEKIEISCERDPWIIDNINASKPSILLMDLDQPKQEIWFERIKQIIKVPLCLGVDGSFKEYLNNRFRKKNKNPFSWNRFKLTLSSAAKYCCWIPPLLLFTALNRLLSKIFYKTKRNPYDRRHLFLSEKEGIFVIPFPSLIHQQAWSENPEWLDEALEYDYVVLDFTSVHHLDLEGMGLLYKVWMETSKLNKSLLLIGVSTDVKHLLKLHGAWDMFQHLVTKDADEVLDRISINQHACLKTEREFISIYQTDSSTILSFFGRIDKMQAPIHSLNHLEPLLNHRSCVVNLKYCTSISNLGFSFLLKLKKLLRSNGSRLIFSAARPSVWKEIKDSKLESEFEVQA